MRTLLHRGGWGRAGRPGANGARAALVAAAALAVVLLGGLAGCDDWDSDHCVDCGDDGWRPDPWAPATPANLWSVTGDEEVFLNWTANAEDDLDGYRVYRNRQATGYFQKIATVGAGATGFVDTNVENGVTYWYAISAFDEHGNESDLCETIHDTPRPEGSGLRLGNADVQPGSAGYDFSRDEVVDFEDIDADIYYWQTADEGAWMIATERSDSDYTDIQDAGFKPLDDVDWAPEEGWAPRGEVPLVEGHSYIVWTWDNHYAKFRVASITSERVVLEWAYQTDEGNPELLLPGGAAMPQVKAADGGRREHQKGEERKVRS